MINSSIIKERKEQILKLISKLEVQIAREGYANVGSASDDDATEFEEFEENVALSNQAQKEMKELKAALKRIEAGTYGKCEKCSLDIENARLKAFPASRFCSTHVK
jgi:RNA polymerase-binding transcription factor DksA